jgi:RimJ/RimL family protein N-acetyltransferase
MRDAKEPPPADVLLRDVMASDLAVFFEHQRDPEANRMAAFEARDKDAFMAHWTKIGADQTVVTRTVVADGQVAGNVGCWEQSGRRMIGYWIGREFWGRGIGTRALSAFLDEVTTRPLYAHVAVHNVASIRVLQKCGFTITDEPSEAPDQPDDGVAELFLKLES